MESFILEDVWRKNLTKFINCFQVETQENQGPKLRCKIVGCSRIYKDKSCAIRHIHANHKNFYEAIRQNSENIKEYDDVSKFEIRCKVDPVEIRNACAELICKNALPLSFVEFPAFKRILEPYAKALKLQGYNLVINRVNIKDHIHKMSEDIKAKIKIEVRRKMISLMMDIGSKYNKSILGVSIAYMLNGKMSVRTIAMHVLQFSSTAENIYKIVRKYLADYDIDINQIISVTTDNGKNMIKAVSMLDAARSGYFGGSGPNR